VTASDEEAGMAKAPYEAIQLEQLPELEYEDQPEDIDWRPIRIHFGITAFGVNVFAGKQGAQVIIEHSETEESGTRHEELYFVSQGRATFTIDGDRVDAPAGTFVYVPDPDSMRGAVAEEDGTTILCLGGTPGEAFSVSPWEKTYDPAA
jgi:mannose-6-phosphate isomerase-like protein (cupin superfamily)